MIFADLALARRLEAAEAANARACAPGEATMQEMAGGWAIFAGADSPLTQAIGIGLHGTVHTAELDAIERYLSHGTRVSLDICPLAEPSLFERLGERGYRITEFNNVLVKPLAGGEIVFAPRVRRAMAGEGDLWSYTVGRGFFDQVELTTAEMEVGRAIFAMPEALCYLAANENGGQPAGGAAASLRDGLAILFADSTIASFRRQGLQRELIAARLNEALARGCDLAAASTTPGSSSQRNYERLGFHVAYTKVTLEK